MMQQQTQSISVNSPGQGISSPSMVSNTPGGRKHQTIAAASQNINYAQVNSTTGANSAAAIAIQNQQLDALSRTQNKAIRKKGKLKDKIIPQKIRDLVPDSQSYMDLLAFERKLDATIMRKRLDIQEALKRPIKVSFFFYVFLVQRVLFNCIFLIDKA